MGHKFSPALRSASAPSRTATEDGGRAGKRWQLQRIAVKARWRWREAYINLIRSRTPPILSEKLSEIDELLPELTLYASFERKI